MKNRPPRSAQESRASLSGFQAAVLSWFVFPGVGQAALRRKGLGQLYGGLFCLFLALAAWPLLRAMQGLYAAATGLEDLPQDIGQALGPALLWGALAATTWAASGIDAWVRASRLKSEPAPPAPSGPPPEATPGSPAPAERP